jgi:L-asparaginase
MTAIRIFVTGGTFDKEYDLINGQLYFKDTHVQEILELGRCTLETHVRPLMMVDSQDMTEADREVIVRNCRSANEEMIVLTHGTDTMVKTAEMVANANIGKTIVLTGAMIPYKFGSSDGLFNLGTAMAFVQSLNAGVYIAMNGRYFNWNNVKKNHRTGFFEEVKPARY